MNREVKQDADTTISSQMNPPPPQKPKKNSRAPPSSIKRHHIFKRKDCAHPPLPIRTKHQNCPSSFGYQPPPKISKHNQSFLKLRESFFGNRSFEIHSADLVKSAQVESVKPAVSYSDFQPPMTSTPAGSPPKCEIRGAVKKSVDFHGNDKSVHSMQAVNRTTLSLEPDNSTSKNSKKRKSAVNIFDQTGVELFSATEEQMEQELEEILKTSDNDHHHIEKSNSKQSSDKGYPTNCIRTNNVDPTTPSCIVINMFNGREVETTPVHSKSSVQTFLNNIVNSIKRMPKVINHKEKTAKSRKNKTPEIFEETISADNTFDTPLCNHLKLDKKHQPSTHNNYQDFHKHYDDSWIKSSSIYNDSISEIPSEVLIDKEQSPKINHTPKLDFGNNEKTFKDTYFDFSFITPPRQSARNQYIKNYDEYFLDNNSDQLLPHNFLDTPQRVHEFSSKHNRNILGNNKYPNYEMKSTKAKYLSGSKKIPASQHEFGRRPYFDDYKPTTRTSQPTDFERLARSSVKPKYKYSDYIFGTPPRNYARSSFPLRSYRRISDNPRRNYHGRKLGHLGNSEWQNNDHDRNVYSTKRVPQIHGHGFENDISLNKTDDTTEDVLRLLERDRFFKKYN